MEEYYEAYVFGAKELVEKLTHEVNST